VSNLKTFIMYFKTVPYFESTDYSIFKFLPFNRDVDKAHVKTLVESMRLHGFKGVIQIIKTKFINGKLEYYVVDGQHRISAASQLGLPIRFELTELNTRLQTAEFISQLNTSAKSWGTANFLYVWSSLGIEEYVKLARVQKETGFQITPLLEAYLFTSDQADYRKGKMTFTNESQSDKIIEQMIELNQYMPSKAFCRRAIIRVMRNPKYNHKKMLNAIKQYVNLVGAFTENERALKAELEKLVKQNC
jgi:hypothetical protein